MRVTRKGAAGTARVSVCQVSGRVVCVLTLLVTSRFLVADSVDIEGLREKSGTKVSEVPIPYRASASRLPWQRRGTGSGVVLDSSGRVLTSLHVVAGCSTRLLHRGSAVIPARLGAEEEAVDLAILIPERPLPAIPAVFREGPVIEGEAVVVAGFPREVVHKGLLKAISANVRALEDPHAHTSMMRISAVVYPGTSGGPVLDRSGRVIGLVAGMLYEDSTGLPVENPGLAVRADVLQRFLRRAGIPFKIDDESRRASIRAIAADAARFTVMVECLR